MNVFSQFKPRAQTVEEAKAIKLFTGRSDFIRGFLDYLHDEPPKKQILFFHGDGGTGKSLLLKILKKQFCKRLSNDNWEWLKNFPNEELIAQVKSTEAYKAVLSADIDFGMSPRGEDRPQESFSALLMLRRKLNGTPIKFPLFDFSCIWYLFQTQKLSNEYLKILFPAEELDLLSSIADSISRTNWGAISKSVIGLLGKHYKHWFTLYKGKRGLSESVIQNIQRMDPETELFQSLPYIFAEDLNAAVKLSTTFKRLVLFFDTHEAFWGYHGDFSKELYFQKDEWFRILLSNLDYSNGIVAVIAGREKPQWDKALHYPINPELVDYKHIENLSRSEAINYLENAGVTEPNLGKTIIESTEFSYNQIHPLYLGLTIDIVLNASEKEITSENFPRLLDNSNNIHILVSRLLKYVDQNLEYAIRALSACRAFDKEIFFELGKAVGFQTSIPTFKILTRFSFIWITQAETGEWYQVHDLLRSIFEAEHDEVTVQAHEYLRTYFENKAKDKNEYAIVEYVYHTNQVDWKLGVREWTERIRKATSYLSLSLARRLIELRGDLIIETDLERAIVSVCEGEYLKRIAKYDEAVIKLNKSIEVFRAIINLNPLCAEAFYYQGTAFFAIGQDLKRETKFKDALFNLYEASEAYKRSLILNFNVFWSHKGLGDVYTEIGDIEQSRFSYTEAQEQFQLAILEFDKGLKYEPKQTSALVNKGRVLNFLGDIKRNLSYYNTAILTYESAINSFDEAISLDPETVLAYSNKAWTFYRIGLVHHDLHNFEDAVINFQNSVDLYDQVIILSPDFYLPFLNKGSVLKALAFSQNKLAKIQDAFNSFDGALINFDEALERAPTNQDIHIEKGITFRGLGDVQASQLDCEDALLSYDASLLALSGALKISPSNIKVLFQKSATLQSLASTQVLIFNFLEAIKNYKKSINICNKLQRENPDFLNVYSTKVVSLRRLGDVYAEQGLIEKSIKSYQTAIKTCEEELRVSPENLYSHHNKGYLFTRMANMNLKSSNLVTAASNYEKALTQYYEVGKHRPNRPFYIYNLTSVFPVLSRVYTLLGKVEQGKNCFTKFILFLQQLINNSPNYSHLLYYLGLTYYNYGRFLYELSDFEEALRIDHLAVETYDKVLEVDPDYLYAKGDKAICLGLIGFFYLNFYESERALEYFSLALEEIEETLNIAPKHIVANNNKISIFRGFGDVFRQLGKFKQAIEQYNHGISFCEQALTIHPTYFLPNKANLLGNIGLTNFDASNYVLAVLFLNQAIVTADQKLKENPPNIVALNSKATAFNNLGKIKLQLSKYNEAKQDFILALDSFAQYEHVGNTIFSYCPDVYLNLGDCHYYLCEYQEAADCFSKALTLSNKQLQISPNRLRSSKFKGTALMNLGKLKIKKGAYTKGKQLLIEAIKMFDSHLKIAPNNILVLTQKGNALYYLVKCCIKLQENIIASKYFELSIEALDKVLILDPDNIPALLIKGKCNYRLGYIYSENLQKDESLKALNNSLTYLKRVYEIAPNNPIILEKIKETEHLLTKVRRLIF